jgi:hypothetical protein
MFTLALLLYSLDLGAVAHDGGGKPRMVGLAPSIKSFSRIANHLQVL